MGRADVEAQIESWGPFAEGKNGFVTNPGLTGIADAQSVTQVALRWMRQRVFAIPKSVRKDRMTQNLDMFDFTLADEEMAEIATLDLGQTAFIDHLDHDQVARPNSLRRAT